MKKKVKENDLLIMKKLLGVQKHFRECWWRAGCPYTNSNGNNQVVATIETTNRLGGKKLLRAVNGSLLCKLVVIVFGLKCKKERSKTNRSNGCPSLENCWSHIWGTCAERGVLRLCGFSSTLEWWKRLGAWWRRWWYEPEDTLYSTHSPCQICAEAIVASGVIRRVVYTIPYKQEVLDYLKKQGIEVFHVDKEILF